MGLMKGPITYRKFYVRGALAESPHKKYLERIRARGFKPLTPEDDAAAVGWVPVERPYDDEVSFRAESVFFGGYLALAIRIDRWKFPTSVVKSKMAAAERAYKQKTGKERISRAEKAELREAIDRKLRREGLPTSSTADVSFNLSTMELRLFGRGGLVAEHFHELFEKTFQLRLLPAGAFVTGTALGVADLATLEPTMFHHGGAK